MFKKFNKNYINQQLKNYLNTKNNNNKKFR